MYKIAKAANTTDDYQYVRRMQAVVDIRNWALYFGLVGVLGDMDHYSYYWVHNYYVYAPMHDRARLMLHDTDWMFNLPSEIRWPAATVVPQRMFCSGVAPFMRAYWSVLKEAADGPMRREITDKWFDDWSAAIMGAGFDPGATAHYKSSVVAARTAIYSGLAGVAAPFAITTSGGADFSTGTNPVTLVGTTPVYVEDIRVNGSSYRVEYTSITNWQIRIWLDLGANSLTVGGYDHAGNLVGSDSITATYTGPAITPDGKLVISEIMYNPAVPYASFVELHNLSTNTLSLGGLRIEGIDCEIGYGNMIGPTGYVVVAGNIAGYQGAYGNAEVVVADFSGTLDNGGEWLRLLRRAGSNAWVAVDEVRYDDEAPWPGAADGGGYSLQLLDPLQDNNRVGNWACVDTNAAVGWRFVSVTGHATSFPRNIGNATVQIYLPSEGQVWVDNVCLVAGAVAEQGVNRVANGDFEGVFAGPWTADGTHVGSGAATNAAFAGQRGLRVLATGAGSTTNNSVHQGSLGLVLSAEYTLSFWYRTTWDAAGLTVEVTETDLAASPPVVPVVPALYTPGTTNSVAGVLPPFPPLWINEVMPVNAGFVTNRYGEYDPWVELYNAGTGAVDLAGLGLSDDYAALGKWVFPGGWTMAGGQRLVVWADGQAWQTTSNELHAGFALNSVSGAVALARQYGSGWVVLDYVNYNQVGTNQSYGSWPEGAAYSRQVFQFPTPGSANSPTSLVGQVRINEWMADNTATLPDPDDSQFEDWFELYNAGEAPVDVAGCQLTDNLASTNRYRVAISRVIAPRGYLLVWADSEAAQNALGTDLHVNFNLSKGGEAIGLYAPDGALVDAVSFGAQRTDVSEGAWPNGAERVYAMLRPTPGASNVVLLIRSLSESPTNSTTLTWVTTPGNAYRVDWVACMTNTNWAAALSVTAVTEVTAAQDDGATGAVQRFYRITELR